MSDVLAFVFIFTIIVTSVGVVSTMGFDVIESTSESEQARNAVLAFNALHGQFEAMESGHVPGRTAELRLSGGAIRLEEGTDFQVYMFDVHDPQNTGSLVYSLPDRDTKIAYENGAVFRESREGDTVMLKEPNVQCVPNERMLISFVRIRTDDTTTYGGEGTIQVQAKTVNSTIRDKGRRTAPPNVVALIHIKRSETRYFEAWKRFYRNEPGWQIDVKNPNYFVVLCPSDADGDVGIYRQTTIDLRFLT